MSFIKELIKNKSLIARLGKNDFKNRFAGTSLGAVWGFISPFIFMFTYVIVFQYILKTKSGGNAPFIVWYLPGMAMWNFINDAIITASNSIRSYSYLVKKVIFPVDIIPVISIVSSCVIGIFICAIVFIIAITRLTSALATLIPDVVQLLSVLMQLFFWFTPIIWNLSMLESVPTILKIAKCMPFTYLVSGFREAFIPGDMITQSYGIYTIVFWVITILVYFWGNSVFNKSKKDFADVL